MKMNRNHNLFSFLSRGVTTTHPWCSVFILCLCFVFCSYNISVFASQSNIPEMTDWQFSQALDAYAGLTDDQKDIANFLVGAQGYAYAGLAQSNLNNSFSSYSDVINYVKDYGAKMWREFDTHVDGVVQRGRDNLLAVKNDLSNFFGNSASYAKTRSESFSAWLGNVGIDYNSSSEFRVQFGKDQVQNNTDFFGDEGFYKWQYRQYYYDPALFSFTWREHDMTATQQEKYFNLISTLPSPVVKYNDDYSYNSVCGSNFYSTYCNIFVNTTNKLVYLCDNSGNIAPNSFSATFIRYEAGFSDPVSSYNSNISVYSLNYNNYNSLYNLYTALSSDSRLLIKRPDFSVVKFSLADFVTGLYIGDSWANKSPWSIVYDLNLSSTSNYVTNYSPNTTVYIDLNGFMRDLYDNPTIIYNYVINNSIDENGDPVDGGDFQPTSKFPGIPNSGITIGTEFFKINGLNPLFGSGGYIDALWNNTKGLVLYIGDILEVLTLDSIDGGGFAWVIYGAISMGVIGGIFSKFLL